MHAPLRPTHGFTLIEVLVVMVMLAIIAGVMAFNMTGSLRGTEIRSVSRDLVAAMRYTRAQAVYKHKEQTINFDVERKTYQAPGKDTVQIPEEMEIKLFTAESEIASDATGRIRFFPDGSSTGGRVTLLMDSRFWRINVAWLTGDIQLFQDTEVE